MSSPDSCSHGVALHTTATRRHGAWLGTVHGNGRPIWTSPLTATPERALQLARAHCAALAATP